MARIAFIHLPFWFSSLECLTRPALRGAPFAIAGQGGRLLAVSPAAFHLGLRADASRSDAEARGIALLAPRTAAYREHTNTLLGRLGAFSPCVEPLGREGVFIDVTGAWYWDGIFLLVDQLQQAVAEVCATPVYMGVGSSRLVSRLAARLQWLRGAPSALVVCQGAEQLFLGPLPLHLVPGISADICRLLYLYGITRLRDVRKLPSELLRLLAGRQAALLQRCASGREDQAVQPLALKPAVRVDRAVACKNGRHQLTGLLYELLQDGCFRLRRFAKQARALRLELTYEDRRRDGHTIRLDSHSCKETVFFAALRGRLDKLLARRVNVVHLRMVFSELKPSGGQGSLFSPPPSRRERLLDVLYRIRCKHGKGTIRCHSLV